jgi:hypothetical protein
LVTGYLSPGGATPKCERIFNKKMRYIIEFKKLPGTGSET